MSPPQNGIKVYLRVKPTSKPSGYIKLDEEEPGKVEFQIPHEVASSHVNNTKTNYKFRFDGVIDQDAKQEDVFDRVARDATMNAMEGFNATVFAYGQTGSGKTFTITGGAERYVDRGIIPRALSLIFGEIEKRTDVQITAHISYLEIYNNCGYDLLDPSHESKGLEDLPKVTMMEDEDGNVHMKNLSMHVVNNEEDALNLLFLGDTNRAISETPMNLASSRSHCIFTISLEMRQVGSDVIRRSKLHLVDLAGSERVYKTNSSGQILREAMAINSSLHYLEMVIVALNERKTKGRIHIPYRNSMMTSVLRDSLGGNCKTSMIATVSAERSNTEESIATCRFAQRVALVQNDALVNEEIDPSALIKRLKAEVAALKEELAFLKGERGSDESGERIDSLERKRLRGIIQDWIQQGRQESKFGEEKQESEFEHDNKLQPGALTFERIHACFEILREFAVDSASGGGSGPPSEQVQEEINNLKQQIQQRDNEIAILVNMVKQSGKGASIPVLSSSSHGDHPEPDLMTQKTFLSSSGEGKETMPPAVAGHGTAVAPVPSSDILADKERSLEHFKRYYAPLRAINENKRILKEKYTHAKQTAEQVNGARSAINRLKSEIEQLRARHAMQEIVDASEEKAADASKEALEREEEEKMALMEKHKAKYKLSCESLKSLKREVERIQALLSNSRAKLQKDFESWYSVVLRQGLSEQVSEPASKSFASDIGMQQRHAPSIPQSGLTSANQFDSSTKLHGKGKIVATASISKPDPRQEEDLPSSRGSMSMVRDKLPRSYSDVHQEEKSQANIPLTGNQEADEDILAFYKAKEQLLKMKK